MNVTIQIHYRAVGTTRGKRYRCVCKGGSEAMRLGR